MSVSPDTPHPIDCLGRAMHDLRISVTDRCNFRCTYCMPEEKYGEHYQFLPREALLSFEEIACVARAAAALGVQKLRITGGEPLLRKDLPELVAMLHQIPGIEDIALTTNGVLLPRFAAALRAAGLHRVTVSLDAMDDNTFATMNGGRATVRDVLDGIAAAQAAGFDAIKVNAVIEGGTNDQEVLPLAEHFRGSGVVIRFIEYMDVGTLNAWDRSRVVSSRELVERIGARFALRPLGANYPGEVAARYAYEDGAGEVGFISSVSQPFCGGCTRLRLSSDGALYTCLFATAGTDLKAPLRANATDADLRDILTGVWHARRDRYSEMRAAQRTSRPKVEMYHIGG